MPSPSAPSSQPLLLPASRPSFSRHCTCTFGPITPPSRCPSARPSLPLPPPRIPHTHTSSLPVSQPTLHHHLSPRIPLSLWPLSLSLCISFKAPGLSQRPWWPQSNGSRWFSRWNGARAEPPPRSGGRSSETRSGRLERRGVEGSGEATELFGVEQRDQSLDSCLFFSTVLVGGEPPVAVHRASSRLS